MKLEPVYLLAPEPEPRPGVSRRTFLGAVAASLGIGVAVGFGTASTVRKAASDPSPTDTAPRDLDWAYELLAGPDSELFANATMLVKVFHRAPDDPRLRDGIARLATYVLSEPDGERRADVARIVHDAMARVEGDAVWSRLRATLDRTERR